MISRLFLRFVMSTADEKVSLVGELDLPHGIEVGLVYNEACPCLQAPQTDGAVFRARQQQGSVWAERQPVHRTVVPSQELLVGGSRVVQHPVQHVFCVTVDGVQGFAGLQTFKLVRIERPNFDLGVGEAKSKNAGVVTDFYCRE